MSLVPTSDLMRIYLEEVVRDGRLERIEAIAHADMVDEANLSFGGPTGRAGLVAHVKGFRRHVTDREITIHEIVGSEDRVMAWWSFTGAHTGPWLGVPATGERVRGDVSSFFSLTAGKISRYRLWLHTDLAHGTTFDSSAALRARREG